MRYFNFLGRNTDGNYDVLGTNKIKIERNINGISNKQTNMNLKYLLLLVFILLIPIGMACVPNWQRDDTPCFYNNTKIIGYIDLNNCNSTNYPYNNGWEDYCNYCSEDLQMIESGCINGTKTTTWVDNNYYSCCDLTGEYSDCSILTQPYNETQNVSCYFDNLVAELGDLLCQTEPNIGVKDKEYCIAHIPLNYTNETFKCIAIITNGLTGEIIQTTPEYRETSQTFINLFPEADTRQWFTPANNIVNFYYTGKNLHPDNDYVLTIECSSSERVLKSQMAFQMAYEDVSFVFFRTRWLMGNAPYLIGGIILIIILLIIAFLIMRGAFR